MSNSVSAELEALRKSGSVKQHASTLKSKSGALSTPEAEEATLAKLKKDDKEKKREAVEGLRNTKAAGGGLVEEELKKVGDRKKEFEKGRSEAKMNLNKGASGGKGSVSAAVVPGETSEEADKQKQANTETVEVEAKNAPTPQVQSTQDDDDDVPDLEEAESDAEQSQSANATTQQQTRNRNEKKVRKIMSRLDMRPVPSIVRAVIKTVNGNFAIERPDVFASGSKGNETYIIFGEARQQQPLGLRKNGSNAAAEAARVLQEVEPVMEDKVEVVGEEDVDVDGLEAKDIELVMARKLCIAV